MEVRFGRFFAFYRDIGSILYPVFSDVAELEHDLRQLLQNRIQAGGEYRPNANGLVKPFGMSLGFLSRLFAVLASGCQLSDLSTNERELTSWVYSKYSLLLIAESTSSLTVLSSLLLLSVSADDELCCTTHCRSDPNSTNHQQCLVL